MAGNSKGNIFKRFGKGVKDVIAELKKVVWPTKEKLVNTSAVVLLVIVFFAIFLTLIGSGGRWLLDKIGFYDTVETTAVTTLEETAATTTTAAETTEATAESAEESATESEG